MNEMTFFDILCLVYLGGILAIIPKLVKQAIGDD